MQSATFSRRSFLAAGGGAMGAAAFAGVAWNSTRAQATSSGRRAPNVVLVLADDLGYGTLGSYGQDLIKTPVLDKLADEGVRYTDFYAGASVCAPSRCTLLTGMHTGNATVRQNPDPGQPDGPFLPDEVTFGHLLQSQGYRTALFGKWGFSPDEAGHYSHPNAQGFDEFYGFLTHIHAHNYYPTYLWHNQTRVQIPANNNDAKQVYAPDLVTERTLDFIDDNKDQPFMVLVSTQIPHAPQHIPDYGIYASESWGAGEKAHAAQITKLDSDVGRIVARLQQHGIADDTIVIFLSDNGPHEELGNGGNTPFNPDFFDANGPLRGYKRNIYDGGIRVPAIIWAPGYIGSKAGEEVSQPLAFWDILPTLADVAGAPVPPFIDGGSIRSTFDATTPAGNEYRLPLVDRPLYWWRVEPYGSPRANQEEQGRVATSAAEACRYRNWKAVRFAPTKDRTAADNLWDFQLYNLNTDIGERTNLAAQYPDVAATLLAYMKQEWSDPSLPRAKWSVSGLVIDPPAVLPVGETSRVVVRLDNHEDEPYTRVDVQLTAPSGWTVRGERRSRVGIRPGQFREFTFDVTVPLDAPRDSQLSAVATYLHDGRTRKTANATTNVTASVPVPPNPVRVPTTGWTFTASSVTELATPPGGRALHAFDGNPNTFWHSRWTPTHADPPHWITAAAPSAVSVAQIRLTPRFDSERPRTLYIKTSDDGTTWTTVATETFASGGVAASTQLVINLRPVTAKFIRLETGPDGTHEVSRGHFVVREIEFWR